MDSIMTNFDSIWQVFIRPRKQEYTTSDLGPYNQIIHGKIVNRKDF
jgi:hypothetical protein